MPTAKSREGAADQLSPGNGAFCPVVRGMMGRAKPSNVKRLGIIVVMGLRSRPAYLAGAPEEGAAQYRVLNSFVGLAFFFVSGVPGQLRFLDAPRVLFQAL